MKYENAFKEFFAELGYTEWEHSGGSNFLINCPFHTHVSSKTFAVDFETGVWHCFNPECGVAGKGLEQIKQQLYEMEKVASFERSIEVGKELLLQDEEVLSYLQNERGITIETAKQYDIALSVENGKKYLLLPVYSTSGQLIAGRKFLLPAYRGPKDAKIKFAWPHSVVSFYPAQALAYDELVLVEGEWDALLLNQHGIPALTTTGGAGYPIEKLAHYLEGKTVYVCYDCDEAGRRGAQNALSALAKTRGVTALHIDLQLGEGEDVTDFFVTHRYSVSDFRALMEKAERFTEPLPPAISMNDLSIKHLNQKYLVTARILGEAGMDKFIWPRVSHLTCKPLNIDQCMVCPLMKGEKTVVIDPSDPITLHLFEKTPDKQNQVVAALAGIPYITNTKRCTHWMYAPDSQKELAVPVAIESVELDTPQSRKGLPGYVTTEEAALKLKSGKEMQLFLTQVQDVNDKSRLTFISEKVIPMQDDLETFRMTAGLHERLKVFQGDPFQKIPEIAHRLNKNVFRINGRDDLVIAYDLAFHSVLAIPNPNAVRRTVKGWVELLVLGDPGEGKSQLAQEMTSYYGLGVVQDGATTTPGGLTVATVQIGGRWMFRDGLLPINDRKLVIIDEFNKLSAEDIGRLNTSRSSGKITASSAAGEYSRDARVRLIWITNPKSGERIDTSSEATKFPIELVPELFEDRGAQDRLDLAVAVLQSDEKPPFDNIPDGYEDPVYTPQLCRSLILWAWSRTPDQIHLTKEAVQAIRTASLELRKQFWAPQSKVELINSGERTTERIIRLATAAAARVYNTPDGEHLFVEESHVRFVVEFMKKQYAKFRYQDYIASLQNRYSKKEKAVAQASSTDLSEQYMPPTKSWAVQVLAQDKLFYDMLDTGQYNFRTEKEADKRNALSWLYARGYVNSEDGVYFKFTMKFHKELAPELEQLERVGY